MIDPNASDWSDLDLLTFAEVHERLANEISAVEHELARIQQNGPDPDGTQSLTTEALRGRLSALRERLAR
jgi:hypothetical protein